MPTFPSPQKNNRIGFHYFPDQNHYRESDLYTWLPELKTLGATWLILDTHKTVQFQSSLSMG